MRSLLLCRLRRHFCHLLVVIVVAIIVFVFVIVIVVVAIVVVVIAIVVVRVRVEHAVEGQVVGVVGLDGVHSCLRVLSTPEGGHQECATASGGGRVQRSRTCR